MNVVYRSDEAQNIQSEHIFVNGMVRLPQELNKPPFTSCINFISHGNSRENFPTHMHDVTCSIHCKHLGVCFRLVEYVKLRACDCDIYGKLSLGLFTVVRYMQ